MLPFLGFTQIVVLPSSETSYENTIKQPSVSGTSHFLPTARNKMDANKNECMKNGMNGEINQRSSLQKKCTIKVHVIKCGKVKSNSNG